MKNRNGRRIVAQVKNEPVYYEVYENADGTTSTVAAADGVNFVAGDQQYLNSIPAGTESTGTTNGATVSGDEPAAVSTTTAEITAAPAEEAVVATNTESAVVADGTEVKEESKEEKATAAEGVEEEEEWEEDEDFPSHLYCELCDVVTNCETQLEIHKRGSRHRKMLRYHGLPEERKSYLCFGKPIIMRNFQLKMNLINNNDRLIN